MNIGPKGYGLAYFYIQYNVLLIHEIIRPVSFKRSCHAAELRIFVRNKDQVQQGPLVSITNIKEIRIKTPTNMRTLTEI